MVDLKNWFRTVEIRRTKRDHAWVGFENSDRAQPHDISQWETETREVGTSLSDLRMVSTQTQHWLCQLKEKKLIKILRQLVYNWQWQPTPLMLQLNGVIMKYFQEFYFKFSSFQVNNIKSLLSLLLTALFEISQFLITLLSSFIWTQWGFPVPVKHFMFYLIQQFKNDDRYWRENGKRNVIISISRRCVGMELLWLLFTVQNRDSLLWVSHQHTFICVLLFLLTFWNSVLWSVSCCIQAKTLEMKVQLESQQHWKETLLWQHYISTVCVEIELFFAFFFSILACESCVCLVMVKPSLFAKYCCINS